MNKGQFSLMFKFIQINNKKLSNILKMNKGYKEEFMKRKIRMVNKLLKQCLNLLMNK